MSSELLAIYDLDQQDPFEAFGVSNERRKIVENAPKEAIDSYRDDARITQAAIINRIFDCVDFHDPREVAIACFRAGQEYAREELQRIEDENFSDDLDRQYRSKYILTPGELVVTEAAREACLRYGRIWADYLDRYLAGDLGDWDDEYAMLANEQAIFMECSVNAYYHLGHTDWLHIQTDAERTLTRIMWDGETREPLPNRIDDMDVPF